MDKEMLKELNDLRKELEISKEEYVEILKMVMNYQLKYHRIINDEQLFQLVQEVLINMDRTIEYDYQNDSDLKSKNAHETLKKVLRNYNYF